MKQRDVVIIGGGLTGISAGLTLNDKDVFFIIIEKEKEVGGLARSIEDEGGFKFDFTGHLLHFKRDYWKKYIFNLPIKLLEIERQAVIFLFDEFHPYPFQIHLSKLPKEVIYDCLYGFIRSWHKRTSATVAKEEVQNFYEFILYYLGEGIARHFMIPYNTKLWGVPLNELTPEWTERFVPKPTLEEVLQGALGIKEIKTGYNVVFYYPETGIGELSKLLSEKIEDKILLSEKVVSIDYKNQVVITEKNESYKYNYLISTIPLKELIQILNPKPPDYVLEASQKLRATPLYYLDVALNREIPYNYHWIYIPEEGIPIYRVGCYTNFSKKLAPEGKSSLYVELSLREKSKIKENLTVIFNYLKKLKLIYSQEDILYYKLRYIPYAYVIYDMNYKEATTTVHSFLRKNNIVSTGRFGEWNYSSMEDGLNMGREVALWIIERLKNN